MKTIVLTLLSVSLVTSLAFVGHKTFSANSTGVAENIAAQEDADRGPVRMIRFVLQQEGIYPRSMQVDAGLVNIALEDRTKASEGLVVESVLGENRSHVTKVRRAEKHWRGRELIRLNPGRYLISDASQPEHQAELIVNR